MAGPQRVSADVLAEKQRVVQERKDKVSLFFSSSCIHIFFYWVADCIGIGKTCQSSALEEGATAKRNIGISQE